MKLNMLCLRWMDFFSNFLLILSCCSFDCTFSCLYLQTIVHPWRQRLKDTSPQSYWVHMVHLQEALETVKGSETKISKKAKSVLEVKDCCAPLPEKRKTLLKPFHSQRYSRTAHQQKQNDETSTHCTHTHAYIHAHLKLTVRSMVTVSKGPAYEVRPVLWILG